MTFIPETNSMVDTNNSTTSLLTNGTSFDGTGTDVSKYTSIILSAYSDKSSALSGLQVRFSTDNVTWYTTASFTLTASVQFAQTILVSGKYFKINYTNGSVTQTVFRLQSIISTTPLSQIDGLVDPNNSSTSVLTENSVFTGIGTDVHDYSSIIISAFSDKSSASLGLQIQFSTDNSIFYTTASFTISSDVQFTQTVTIQGQYYRIVYTNGGTTQTAFRLQSIASISTQSFQPNQKLAFTFTAQNQTVSLLTAGFNGFAVTISSNSDTVGSDLVASDMNTITPQLSMDGGSTWINTICLNASSYNTTTSIANVGTYTIQFVGGVTNIRLLCSEFSSGSIVGTLSGSTPLPDTNLIRGYANVYSVANSTTGQLASGATFEGTWEADLTWQGASMSIFSSQNMTIKFQQSNNGSTVHNEDSFTYLANSTSVDSSKLFNLLNNYHRVTVTNNGSATTSGFFLNTYMTPNWAPVAGRTLDVNGGQAVSITADMGIQVARGLIPQQTAINKFGRNSATATSDAIWSASAAYTAPAAGLLCNVVSTSTNDASAGTGARTIYISGLNDLYDQTNETVTLNGTSNVSTVQKYINIYSAYVLTAGTVDSADGTITITQQTSGTLLATILPVVNASQSTIFMVPRFYTAYVNAIHVVAQNITNSAVIDLGLFRRDFGGVLRIVSDFLFSQGSNSISKKFEAPLVFPEKSTILFKCSSAANGTWDVAIDYDIYLIKN